MRRRETGCQKVPKSAGKCQKVPENGILASAPGIAPKFREIPCSSRMENQNPVGRGFFRAAWGVRVSIPIPFATVFPLSQAVRQEPHPTGNGLADVFPARGYAEYPGVFLLQQDGKPKTRWGEDSSEPRGAFAYPSRFPLPQSSPCPKRFGRSLPPLATGWGDVLSSVIGFGLSTRPPSLLHRITKIPYVNLTLDSSS
jgi:hypothetical protein